MKKLSTKATQKLEQIRLEMIAFLQEKVSPLAKSGQNKSTVFSHYFLDNPDEEEIVPTRTFTIPGKEKSSKKILGFTANAVVYQEPLGAFNSKFTDMEHSELLMLVSWVEDNFDEFEKYIKNGRQKLEQLQAIKQIFLHSQKVR